MQRKKAPVLGAEKFLLRKVVEMNQTRIVVRDSVLRDGHRLLKATKIGSLSELFNVLVARYGKHLESTWVLPITQSTPVEASENKEYESLHPLPKVF